MLVNLRGEKVEKKRFNFLSNNATICDRKV